MNVGRLVLGLSISSAALLVVSCACTNGCRLFQDNATSLAYRIEDGVARLNSLADGAELVVAYEPVSNRTERYTILLLPKGPVSEDDLVRKGIPWSVSHKILKDLNYVGGRDGNFIIVYQNKQINFTRYGMHLVKPKTLLVQENRGKSWILLKKEYDGILVTGIK